MQEVKILKRTLFIQINPVCHIAMNQNQMQHCKTAHTE